MPDLLRKYRQMRSFEDTPEPAGGRPRGGALPIFVIQKHRASHLHYDFRLEMEGVLKSWAIPKGPSYDPGVRRLAMMTEDHPYDYASFEGQIPEGNYGAGNVIIWDQGEWELIEPASDPAAAVKAGKLTFRLYGRKMFGEWALVRINGRSRERGNEWLLLKHRDAFADDSVDVTKVAPRSVVSNLLVEEISGENTWASNRKSVSKRVPTLASRAARGSSRNSGTAKKLGAGTKGRAAGQGGPATSSKKGSKKRKGEKTPVKSGTASKTTKPAAKAKAATKRAPARATSVRTGSSRAAAKSPARTTGRRQPR